MLNKYNKFVYIIYQDDRLQLPIYVADSLSEMSELTGLHLKFLNRVLSGNETFLNNYKIEKVDIREPEEKFTETEYKKFCKKHNLQAGSFSSQKMFAKYCYGAI